MPEHIHRIFDARLSVDTEFLHQRMKDFPILGKFKRACDFQGTVNVFPFDLLVFAVDAYHTVTRHPNDVLPADADDYIRHFRTSLKFSLIGDAGDGFESLFDVDDGTGAHSFTWALANGIDHKLSVMEDELKGLIFGQDEAVEAMADIIGGSPLTNTLNTLDELGLLAKSTAFVGMNLPMLGMTPEEAKNLS